MASVHFLGSSNEISSGQQEEKSNIARDPIIWVNKLEFLPSFHCPAFIR